MNENWPAVMVTRHVQGLLMEVRMQLWIPQSDYGGCVLIAEKLRLTFITSLSKQEEVCRMLEET